MRAIPEFVKEGYNGFMVTPDIHNREKMIQHIHEKLEKYFSDSELLKSHSHNALETVESRFLIEHRNKKLKKIYDDILS
jgi:glycosyltransferase involved in cell wall biosynthesis